MTKKANVNKYLRTSTTVSRRADLFAYPERHSWRSRMVYASGFEEGIINVLADPRGGLNGDSLLLFVTLCEWYLQKRVMSIEIGNVTQFAVVSTAHELVQEVLGSRNERAYDRLGLAPNVPNTYGALQRLATTLITIDSTWINQYEEQVQVHDGFPLVIFYRWIETAGRPDRVAIVLANIIQNELVNHGITKIPTTLVRHLGVRNARALRVALHVLSHEPLASGQREITLTALISIIRPDANRMPKTHPGRFHHLVLRVVHTLNAADPDHAWQWQPAESDPLGKIVCINRKSNPAIFHDISPNSV